MRTPAKKEVDECMHKLWDIFHTEPLDIPMASFWSGAAIGLLDTLWKAYEESKREPT